MDESDQAVSGEPVAWITSQQINSETKKPEKGCWHRIYHSEQKIFKGMAESWARSPSPLHPPTRRARGSARGAGEFSKGPGCCAATYHRRLCLKQIHGIIYDGPTYQAELEAARAALASQAPAQEKTP